MAAVHDQELLAAARQLLVRSAGQRGKLPSARIRRSISTAYYSLFHFLLLEAGVRIIGAPNKLRRRRRTFARAFTHTGVKNALEKVRGAQVDASVTELLRPAGQNAGPVASPAFVRSLAAAFSDAQAKRHDADYDLNEALTELDAQNLIVRVEREIAVWRAANTPSDRDFKHALCVLLLLKGQLRRET